MDAITILLDAKNSVTDPLARHSIYNAIDYLQRGHYDWCETYQPGICQPVCDGTFAAQVTDSLQYLLTQVNNGDEQAQHELNASHFKAGRDYVHLGSGLLAVQYYTLDSNGDFVRTAA